METLDLFYYYCGMLNIVPEEVQHTEGILDYSLIFRVKGLDDVLFGFLKDYEDNVGEAKEKDTFFYDYDDLIDKFKVTRCFAITIDRNNQELGLGEMNLLLKKLKANKIQKDCLKPMLNEWGILNRNNE